jgi:hypothetical protein
MWRLVFCRPYKKGPAPPIAFSRHGFRDRISRQKAGLESGRGEDAPIELRSSPRRGG